MPEEPLTIESRPGKSPETRVIKLHGPITLSNSFAFQTELRKDTHSTTILDFSDVPYMDSAGMGVIINYYVSCQKHGRKLVLAAVCDRIFALLELTKTNSLLTLVPNVEDAE